jgi:hypothetical protein
MSEWLRESTWGFPIVSAVHVLGLAWFGGTLLIADRHLRAWTWTGAASMFLSGALLFALHPARYDGSVSFRVKMLLLLLAGANAAFAHARPRLAGRLAVALWIGIIFASRGIAFF